MENDLPEIKRELVDLKTRLLDPDAGLYTRVKDLRVWSTGVGEEFERLQEQIDENVENFNKKEEEVHGLLKKIEEQVKPLAELEEKRLKRKKWVEKIVWVIIPIVVAAFTKAILSVIDIQEMLQKQQMRKTDNIVVVD